MKRTLIQFDEPTYQRLRQEAFRQARSVSSLVREAVARELAGGAPQARPPKARLFRSVAAGRSRQVRGAPVSEQHDAALRAAFDD